MPLFKRKDKTTIAELEEYYAENKSRRTGMAWLMAFLSIMVTALVLIGLFLASRWAYRTFIDDSAEVGVSTGVDQEARDAALPSYDTDKLGGVGLEFGDSESDNPDDIVTGDTSIAANGNEGVVSDEAASTSREVAGDSDEDQSSFTDDSNSEIPDTGAGEVLVIAPLVAGVTGYVVSRKRQLR